MKRTIYMIAIFSLISIVFITFSRRTALALQESSESVEAEVGEYDPNYRITEEPAGENMEIYTEPDTEPIPDTELEYERSEDHYWWEDDQSGPEHTIPEDPNQQSHYK